MKVSEFHRVGEQKVDELRNFLLQRAPDSRKESPGYTEIDFFHFPVTESSFSFLTVQGLFTVQIIMLHVSFILSSSGFSLGESGKGGTSQDLSFLPCFPIVNQNNQAEGFAYFVRTTSPDAISSAGTITY